MNLFSQRVFGYAFGIALGIAFAVALAAVIYWDAFSILNVFIALVASLAISAVLATLVASYKLPRLYVERVYRAVMRRLAKKAIRSSLSYAMMPIECTGILETDFGFAVRIQAGGLQGVTEGSRFNVHESTDNRLWGKVFAVEVRDNDCDCVPYDRVNEAFWAELESRVRTDTSAPSNVHLVRDTLESGSLDGILRLLDDWR